MSDPTFATAIACIDGRVHGPLASWVRERIGVDHVDLITEPGADNVCAYGDDGRLAAILERVQVSATAHASSTIVVAGHADCAANPVDAARHRVDIRIAMERVRALTDATSVIGIWIDDEGEATEVSPVGDLAMLVPDAS
jgi:hypothetical protein